MSKIFLTGGTGFFGRSILSCLRRGLLSEGTELVILSRRPEKFLAAYPEFAGLPGVRHIAGDVRNFVFPDEEFDAVIHAATPAVTTLAPGEMRSIVVEGTRRTAEFARFCGAKKLLLTSSGAVYGVQPPELEHIPEDFPCRPVTEYGIAKLEAEKICADSGVPALIARCFAFSGPYLDRNIHFAFGNFLRDALAGRPIVVQGDGTPLRSYLYADDLVTWLFRILAAGTPGRPVNVGSSEAVSIAELAETIRDVLQAPGKVVIREKPVSGRLPARYVPSVERAEKELDLVPMTSLADAIRLSAARK
ncbi:MAG: NAD(P)-dependent oxidoreductase [Lentisphaeria bacterium]|nr:NAD(P)-dependent oxidoreductase [Lentisphaeria bacterium]